MQNLLIAFVLVTAVASATRAQDDTTNPYLLTGRSLIGGGLSLDLSTTNPDNGDPASSQDTRRFGGSLSPTYGRMYNDRWMVGVMTTFSTRNTRQENEGPSSLQTTTSWETGIGLTPFLRRYLPITERFGAYLQPELAYTYFWGTNEFERRDDAQPDANSLTSLKTRRHVFSLGTQLGLYYFITKHFAVETNLIQAAFSANRNRIEQIVVDNVADNYTENTTLSVRLNVVNQLSLDHILVLNYYF